MKHMRLKNAKFPVFRKIGGTFIFLLYSLIGYTQSANVALNEDYYHLLDRSEIKQTRFSTSFFSNFRPFSREAIASFLDSLPQNIDKSSADRFNRQYLSIDSWEFTNSDSAISKKPFLKKLYYYKNDLYAYHGESFDLHVSPVLYLAGGTDQSRNRTTYINTRGLEVRGRIDNKVSFYSYIGENQTTQAGYITDWNNVNKVVPNEGFWKTFGDNGFDYLTVRGYVNFNATKHIGLQLGYDKNVIGSGQRSLLLSDFSSSYPFLKLNTQIWKLQYQVMYAQLIADQFSTNTGSLGVNEFPKKFMTMHHLSVNLAPNFTLGIFESIIFDSKDSLANSRFEMHYLNPLIFYGAIEQQVGSPDNYALGTDFRWNLKGKYQLYGQFFLDEFVGSELFSNSGWWSNKYAFQLGGKYIDVLGVNNLDLQLEYNFARPYTYAHQSMRTNYTHYRQPLAHPRGANFKEFLAVVRYQPLDRLTLRTKLLVSEYGLDTGGSNFGGDIRLPYATFEQEYGNVTGQGLKTNLIMVNFVASYQLRHNLFTDLSFTYRDEKNQQVDIINPTKWVQLSIRLNAPLLNQMF
jgi:hypothetical protein